MKPGADGVCPVVVFRKDIGRYEYGTARITAISPAPVITRIGFAASLHEAMDALEALGWEFEGVPFIRAEGNYANLPIKDARK